MIILIKITGYADNFSSLRNKPHKDFWRRWSTCKIIVGNIEEDATALKKRTWRINFQVSDAQFSAFSNVSFIKKVTFNDYIVDTHYKRAMDKAKKEIGKVIFDCVTRPFY